MTAPIPFAHRGGIDGGHPENSLAAFADALARGAALETDVRLSSDGVPVLVHDAHFARSGVPFPVRATRAATLARHGIPSLADLYHVLGTRFELSIDVKARAAARPAIDIARDADARRRLWLVHGDLATLGELRVYDTEVRLVHEAHPPEGDDLVAVAGARARELAARGIDTENRHWGSWTPAQVDAMHAHDALAFGSLVHRADELADAASRGLDALYSDHVDATRGRGERERGVSPAVQAVLFDFGSTLFGHEPGPVVVRREAAALGVTLSMAEAASIWADIDAAASTPAELARRPRPRCRGMAEPLASDLRGARRAGGWARRRARPRLPRPGGVDPVCRQCERARRGACGRLAGGRGEQYWLGHPRRLRRPRDARPRRRVHAFVRMRRGEATAGVLRGCVRGNRRGPVGHGDRRRRPHHRRPRS